MTRHMGKYWEIGRGNQDAEKDYNISRLIVLRADNISTFVSNNNQQRAKELGLFRVVPSFWIPLADKLCKYYERFTVLPNDELAQEWLNEALEHGQKS